MRKPPARATGLLLRLGPQDESFVGDLVEEYRAGRSRAVVLAPSAVRRPVGLCPASGRGRCARSWPSRPAGPHCCSSSRSAIRPPRR